MSRAVGLGVAALLCALPVAAQDVTAPPTRSPRSGSAMVRVSGYKPLIDKEEGLKGTPYKDTFGDASLLVVEAELQSFFYQGIGTAGVGLSAGYGEKYAPAKLTKGEGDAAEKTALKLIPLQVNGFYKFDYAAFQWGIPFVPYGKLGLVYTPWWMTKGNDTQEVNGNKAAGGKWGWAATGGVSFLMDVLEPRFARDFDSDLGVNHTYLFAEYTYAEVNNFGGKGLNLSSRRWLFGLALDY
jgi:hypothetical protein